jgi:hypothetical protein
MGFYELVNFNLPCKSPMVDLVKPSNSISLTTSKHVILKLGVFLKHGFVLGSTISTWASHFDYVFETKPFRAAR